jgi:hypothetical protein
MDRHEVAMILQARKGQRARIRFSENVTQVVVIESVDEQGFRHSGPDGTEPNGYWTRLEDVLALADE